jgi:hypothetical protein
MHFKLCQVLRKAAQNAEFLCSQLGILFIAVKELFKHFCP